MKFIIAGFFLLVFGSVKAQLTGIVYGSDTKSKESVIGAKLFFLHARSGAITDNDGKFSLEMPAELPDSLVVSAMGYRPDTLVITKKDRFTALEITLFSDLLLDEVVIQARQDGHAVSRLNPLLVEQINSHELRKAACCNLSESFETNASVDVNITDAVTGAKRIQMMGLDGVYTQIQFENIPALRGLESAFGLNSIPGTWINSMQITKGAGNAVNGYESMAGLINIEFKKPREMERLYLNGYANRFGRYEFNADAGHILNDKWSTGWFVHASANTQEFDHNDDGFRDLPTGNLLTAMNRWKYQGEKFESVFGVRAYLEDKTGGQLGATRSNMSERYGTFLNQGSVEAFAKTGFLFKQPYRSLGVIYNYKQQFLDFDLSTNSFAGREKRGYVNLLYDDIIGSTIHKYKVGASFVYDDISQKLGQLLAERVELTPGVYGEYTYSGVRLTAVAGARFDYDNLFGSQFSPRVHAKYILTENTDLRVTAGRGWRVPNFIVDNLSLLTTSRSWVVAQTLQPEIAYNAGASIVQRFKMFGHPSSLTLDYFHTDFQQQLLVDRDLIVNAIVFRNLEGRSFSNSIQAEWQVEPVRDLVFRFAYKLLDVRAEYGGELQQKVMVPRHRGFANVAYQTRNKKWEFDLTGNIIGQSRLPVSQLPGGTLTTKNTSDTYALLNAQITYIHKRFSIYLGGENLTNYKQKNAIIDAQNPFGPTFDATRIWGPIMGANVYVGFRFELKRLNSQK